MAHALSFGFISLHSLEEDNVKLKRVYNGVDCREARWHSYYYIMYLQRKKYFFGLYEDVKDKSLKKWMAKDDLGTILQKFLLIY